MGSETVVWSTSEQCLLSLQTDCEDSYSMSEGGVFGHALD